MMPPDEQPDQPLVDFEEALADLEEIVRRLESGDLPLADSLAHYERGVERLRQCYRALDTAQARVKQLSVSTSGQLTEAPFEQPHEGDDAGA